MASQAEKALAYEAGRAVLNEPPDRQSPDACPFAPGSDERAEWLRGFSDALDEVPDIADLRRALKDARP